VSPVEVWQVRRLHVKSKVYTASMPDRTRFSADPVCAVVAATSAASMRRQLQQALQQTRTVELRLDWLSSERERRRLLRWLAQQQIPATLIATCRRRRAGGRFRGSLAAQRRILEDAVTAGCQCYDIELESLREGLPFPPVADGHAIVSLHCFTATQQTPQALLGQLRNYSGAIPKLALHCQRISEAMALLGVGRRRRAILVPMGEAAVPARVLALAYGSLLTYAHTGRPTAAGQLSLQEALSLYRVRNIGPRTQLFGLVGHPIGHSLSPLVHNRAFQVRRLNAVYLPFPTPELADFLRVVEQLHIAGFSVTLPYKEAILRYLAWVDPLARRVGAVNTVVVQGRRLLGYNTDYCAVLSALRGALKLQRSRAVVLGAGGAARAAAFALTDAGAEVFIWARRLEQAASLARAVGGAVIDRRRLAQKDFDLLVNATPVGMMPDFRRTPLRADELHAAVVFDMVYRPERTRLLQLAARKGARTVSGLRMFVAQAAAQWELWMSRPAPVLAMWRAARRAAAE
jgi:3-dehydroquinate dehydratase/shikimate dehydrogenase